MNCRISKTTTIDFIGILSIKYLLFHLYPKKIKKLIPIIALGMSLLVTTLNTYGQSVKKAAAAAPPVTQPNNPPGIPGPVTGPTSVAKGTINSVYSVTAGANATSYSWGLSPSTAGTISPSGTNATITWNSSFSGGATISCLAVNSLGTASATPLSVTVVPPPTATISPSAISIVSNTSPGAISVTSPVDLITYSYQWQNSTNNSTWSNIIGATGTSYTPGNLTATTYYKVILTNNNTDLGSYSNTTTVTVYPSLVSGGISPAAQSINYNSIPPALTATTATGGNGIYTYQWQSSPNNSTWSNITGATALTYTPATAITTTIYYRIIATCLGTSVNSNATTVNVYPQLIAGSISPATQTINYNSIPPALTATAATGGNGIYTYQWQSSPNNSTWSNITGATTLTYTPTTAITAPIYYRIIATCNGVSVNSNAATVNVYPQLVAGSISPAAQSINYNSIPAVLTAATATGGNGTYTYQWQTSVNNSIWTNITGATALTYTPATAITATTYYRIVATSNGVSVNSSTATVNVYPQLVAGSISPATQTIAVNSIPATLSISPSGGSGVYTYQWQISTDNINFNNIAGATANSWTPTLQSVTSYYRVMVNSNGVSITSNSAAAIVSDCIPLKTSPTSALNYIMTSIPRSAGYVPGAAGYTTCDVMQSIQYIDGLGRPLQTVQVNGSPLNRDVIQPFSYDSQSRDSVKYLPYTLSTTTPGAYQSNAINGGSGYTTSAQYLFYQQTGQGFANTANPYSQTGFEPSPLNRVIEQGAPGAAWQLSTSGISGAGHTVKMAYTFNNTIIWTADSVKSMQVALYNVIIKSDKSRLLIPNGYYPANTLTITISKDENWTSGRAGTIEEYKDKDGHVVLKRVYNYTSASTLQQLSTYYVYDDLGNLAFVLPPLAGGDAAAAISQTTLDNLCYQYRYDYRNRLSQKKLPGKGWEYMVYNNIDQVVATQDANQRTSNQWLFTKYDALGRVAMTGIWNNNNTAISQAALQTTITAITTNLWETRIGTGNGYTNVAWPTANVTATLSLNYYDSYTGIPNLPANYTMPAGASTQITGLLAAKVTAVLNTPTDQLWDVMYYDGLGRNIQTYAQHYLGGVANVNNYDVTTSTYNFTNAPTTVTRKHYNTTSTTTPLVTIANTYIYDHMGRKLKTWEQITNGSSAPTTKTLISQIDYNEIGQVLTKHLHSTDSVNFYQNIGYTYNERGWLLSSSAPLFAMQLSYNTLTNKAYNGNIMYQYWGVPGNLASRYAYAYDKLNRLTAGSSLDNNNEYPSYDVMGNITALQRSQAGTTIDNLTYNYSNAGNPTNQLQSITDGTTNNTGLVAGTTNYTYDANGNMLSSSNSTNTAQNKTLTYNLLNLPQTVNLPTGAINLTYTYDAAGAKLRKKNSATGNTTDYVAGIQYDGTTTPSLSFIQTEEGKAVPTASGYDYVYYLGDNLGNTRVTFNTKTGTAVKLQQDDYYPFGMEINRLATSPKNEYLYNKKELQEELGQYDYGARFYDPVIARWNTIDPLAEISRRWSTYAYVLNNPIRNIDPDGMIAVEGPFGTTIDVSAFDHWSANGDVQGSDGKMYSGKAFANKFPNAKIYDNPEDFQKYIHGEEDPPGDKKATQANQGGDQYPRGAVGGPVPWYGNFLGPGPDGNPYNLRGYDGKILKPIDAMDAAAQRHDYAYYLAHTGGVKGALFDDAVGAADRALAGAAFDVQVLFNKHLPDPITHQPISDAEEVWAQRVTISFAILGGLKGIVNMMGRLIY